MSRPARSATVGPHRVAVFEHRRVDFLGERALLDEEVGLLAIGREDAVADEAVADAGDDGDLAEAAGDRHGGGEHVGRGHCAANHLEQLHHVGGTEEMEPDHGFRPARRAGDVVDVEIARIGGEHRAFRHDGVELAENLALQAHVLEHRLDDEIGDAGGLETDGEGGAAEAALALGGVDAAALDHAVVKAGDAAPALFQRFGAGLDHRHLEAGIEAGNGDAGAHGAGADDGDAGDRTRGDPVEAGHLADLALGEEGVSEGRRLVGRDEFEEDLALAAHPLGKVHAGDVADRSQRPERRKLAARLLRDGRLGLGEFRLGEFRHRKRGGHRVRPALLGALAHEGDGGADRIVVDDEVGKAVFDRLGRADAAPARHHVDRRGKAGKARQALGAAGAGDDAEGDFGKADPGVRLQHPVVAAERQLEAAAEGGAVDRRGDGLCAILDRGDDVGQEGRHRRLAEFADVGAGDEAPAGAGEHGGNDAGVGLDLGDRLDEAPAHGLAQRVDRRIVDEDDGDAVLALDMNDGSVGHLEPPLGTARSSAAPVRVTGRDRRTSPARPREGRGHCRRRRSCRSR